MPTEKIYTGTELPRYDLDAGQRALTDMMMLSEGAVPKITPEVPMPVKHQELERR